MSKSNEIVAKDFIDEMEARWLDRIPSLDLSGTSIIARIVRMNYFVARRVEANLERYKLSLGEFEVLAALVREKSGQLTPGALQELILISSGGLSSRINRLEEKEHIVRLTDPADKRGVIVRLTPQGKALIEEVIPTHLAIEKELVQGMSQSDQKKLIVLLRKLHLSQK